MLKQWTRYEKLWAITAISIITLVSILMKDNWIGFVSSITGIICVLMAAKGKISTFYFGIIQASTYAYLAYTYTLYGEAMLNAFFFLPIQFVGLYMWSKNKKQHGTSIIGEDITARKLTPKQWILVITGILIASSIYAIILETMNAAQVRLDSFAVIISIFAQILMLYRYAEQWIMWITVNVLTITLWGITLIQTGGGDWAIFTMWCAFLVNSIYGYLNWRKLNKLQAG